MANITSVDLLNGVPNTGTGTVSTIDALMSQQTDGSSKTQIVDGGGNVIGSTSNALDVHLKAGTDTVGSVGIQVSGSPVATGNPVPVAVVSGGGTGGGDATAANQDIINTRIGPLTETAPATDTASSGLNGRLQRIAQRLTSLIALFPSLVSGRWPVDGSGVTQPVSATSLPLPSGAATSAKQPALGTAGSASADVLSVQGVASMTALKVDGSAVTQPVSAASLPLPSGASTAAKQPALGTAGTPSSDVITVQGASSMTPVLTTLVPRATANGATSTRVVAAATTNATSLKASAGNLVHIDLFNVAAYDVFVKLYNKASAPTVGTDTPVWTIPIKAGTGYARTFPVGKSFATGIAFAITKLQADSDTTAVAASDVTGAIDWI